MSVVPPGHDTVCFVRVAESFTFVEFIIVNTGFRRSFDEPFGCFNPVLFCSADLTIHRSTLYCSYCRDSGKYNSEDNNHCENANLQHIGFLGCGRYWFLSFLSLWLCRFLLFFPEEFFHFICGKGNRPGDKDRREQCDVHCKEVLPANVGNSCQEHEE